MKKDTRFSIRKLTVGVASIAVASFLASGTVDAANLSILDSRMDEEGHNPELPFESFPPSISYTQPEAPWMLGSSDTEVPGDDVEEVTEPGEANYENPEAPFAPVEEVTEPSDASYVNPEAPFAPVEEVTQPSDANYENPEAPFAPVEEDEEVTEPRKPNYEDPEAPFAPVEEDEEVTEPRKPNYEDPEAPFAPVEEEEVTEPRDPNYENPEAPFAPVEEEEVTEPRKPNYEDPEAPFAPVEEEEVEETPEEEELEVLPGYKVEEAIGADGKKYKRLVPIEEVEEDLPTLEVKVVQETEIIPYETERRENADLYVGDEEIITPGQEGKVVKEFEVTYAGDKEVSRKELRVVESVDPVTEIVEYGTKPVKDTKVETRRVEEALPVVEKEDPELLEGETHTEPGSLKVTEITEKITYERGKEVSREIIKKEVIDQGTAEIKYVGIKRVETITETETIPYETERRENADLYVGDEEIVIPGQEGKVVKEFEVTYAGDKEVSRKELRVVESVDPVTEIVEYGTKPVKETKEETRQVEAALPVVEKEDPELLEGEFRTEEGSPKVTEITEEIIYERGKEVSRKTIEEKVIDEGTAGIKYIGIKRIETITETETLTHETERRENADLYEGTERVVQEGKDGSVTKEYEVTYIKGKETNRQEVRVVKRVEPENKIIEYGIKEDKLLEWDVEYDVIPLPSPKLKETVVETRHALNTDVKDFYDRLISENGGTDSSSTDELTDDQKAQVLASALDYYRKAMGDENIKLEQLITDSADKKGSFYETLVLAGANKLGITEVEKDQEPDYYKNILLENKAYDGKQIYKDIVVQENSDGTLTSGTPSPEAVNTVTHNLEEIEELLEFGHGVFINYVLLPEYQNAIRSTDIPEEDKKKLQAQLEEIKNFDKLDTTAASLDFYRVLTNKPEATLQDVLIDWAQSKAGLTLTGALEMVNRYDSSVGGGTDTLNVYKKLMRTRHGQLMESEWTFFTDPFFKILEGIGETVEP